ncbi:MAG: YciI family protein [Verrucomicrobiota bacterium]
MKFLMLMIPRIYQPDIPAAEKPGEGWVLSLEEMEPMGKFNDELAKAGRILDIDGLQPLDKGARVSFANGKATVTDGPYIETKDVIGGYWIVELKSKEEALEWARRCPAQDGDVIEIRPIFELPDLSAGA